MDHHDTVISGQNNLQSPEYSLNPFLRGTLDRQFPIGDSATDLLSNPHFDERQVEATGDCKSGIIHTRRLGLPRL